MIKIDGQPAVLVEYRVNEGRFYFVPQEGTQRQTYSAPQPELLLGHLKMLMRIRAATQETIAGSCRGDYDQRQLRNTAGLRGTITSHR
jgi:hypothetical protein